MTGGSDFISDHINIKIRRPKRPNQTSDEQQKLYNVYFCIYSRLIFQSLNSRYFRSRLYSCIFHGSTRQTQTRPYHGIEKAIASGSDFEKSLKVTQFITAYNFYGDLKAAIESPSCAVSYYHTEKHFELSCSNRFRMRRLLRRVPKMIPIAHIGKI